jgi:hypothetical protein
MRPAPAPIAHGLLAVPSPASAYVEEGDGAGEAGVELGRGVVLGADHGHAVIVHVGKGLARLAAHRVLRRNDARSPPGRPLPACRAPEPDETAPRHQAPSSSVPLLQDARARSPPAPPRAVPALALRRRCRAPALKSARGLATLRTSHSRWRGCSSTAVPRGYPPQGGGTPATPVIRPCSM